VWTFVLVLFAYKEKTEYILTKHIVYNSWSCLAQWLNAQSRNPTCPVCKAGCGKDKVIPIYGRGKEEKDPR
jgi:hypothetical protein